MCLHIASRHDGEVRVTTQESPGIDTARVAAFQNLPRNAVQG
jgi:hypothetical protein